MSFTLFRANAYEFQQLTASIEGTRWTFRYTLRLWMAFDHSVVYNNCHDGLSSYYVHLKKRLLRSVSRVRWLLFRFFVGNDTTLM